MNTNFAGVVDEVRELSVEEWRELLNVIEQSLVDERREEIFNNVEDAKRAFGNGELKLCSNADDLMKSLND